MLFLLLPVVFTIGFVLTFIYERKAWKKKQAAASHFLDHDISAGGSIGAVEGQAAPIAAPVTSPITGRSGIAIHIEVVTRERHPSGGGEEIIVRRAHEEAYGNVLVLRGGAPAATVDASEAQLIEPVSIASTIFTIYASQTSAFAGREVVPEPIGRFLYERNLPMPRQDAMFAAGFQVLINERIITPNAPVWFAGPVTHDAGPDGRPIARLMATEDVPVYFGLEPLSAARQKVKPKIGEIIWTAGVVATLLTIVAGMIIAFASK
jgi:hypothetical protein